MSSHRTLLQKLHSNLLNLHWRCFQYLYPLEDAPAVLESGGTQRFDRQFPYLHSLIRRYPYWQAGHRRIAEGYLEQNEVQKAYLAAQCFRSLCASSTRWQADLLIGRCYLKTAEFDKAINIFQPLHTQHRSNAAIAEEYAAALLGGERYIEAARVLEDIPESSRSSGASMVLAGCQRAIASSNTDKKTNEQP